MTDAYTIRPAVRTDEPYLKLIWKNCFGDNDTQTDLFFGNFFLKDNNTAVVAERDGYPIGAAYSLRCGEIAFADGRSLMCPYVYGVGVLPEARHRGIGAELTVAATADHSGISAIVPSSRELFRYYGNLSYSNSYRCRTIYVRANQTCVPEVNRIRSEHYFEEREPFLSCLTHMKWMPYYYRHFEALCAESGGLFSINRGKGIAAVEITGKKLVVKELLCPTGEEIAYGAALAFKFAMSGCSIRIFSPHGASFGMSRPALNHPAWFGLALD
ncbi:MAG: GNAT family N-acetyltransferase [Clostridiales bacterium]|nr:GNAT family N-acetyltransferase [Clostridiales bacterium]